MVNVVSRNPRRGTADARRAQRKLEKMQQFSHSGFAGMSIIEMLEERLANQAAAYLRQKQTANEADPDEEGYEAQLNAVWHLRGEIRSLAVSIAMMRHPYKRYQQVWWNYVKKLEKRAVAKARESNNSAG